LTGVESRRREEQLTNKPKSVRSFFDWVRKNPAEVAPTDIRACCEQMRDEGKGPAIAYAAPPSSPPSTVGPCPIHRSDGERGDEAVGVYGSSGLPYSLKK